MALSNVVPRMNDVLQKEIVPCALRLEYNISKDGSSGISNMYFTMFLYGIWIQGTCLHGLQEETDLSGGPQET